MSLLCGSGGGGSGGGGNHVNDVAPDANSYDDDDNYTDFFHSPNNNDAGLGNGSGNGELTSRDAIDDAIRSEMNGKRKSIFSRLRNSIRPKNEWKPAK